MSKLYGAIEAGGTKFVCMLARSPEDILAEVRFPTTTPDESLTKSMNFFREESKSRPIASIGIGMFGPLDLDPKSPTYGYVADTPKPGWSWADVAPRVEKAMGVPVQIDTDVNAAALGEHVWGAAQGIDQMIYMTVGTGIGGGGMSEGKLIHGLVHPEMGHIRIPHDILEDPYPGSCPFHGDCFEGLATGPAMKLRWNTPAENLPRDHPGWKLEAKYIGAALCNLVLILSPKKIILGGGVMQQEWLFPYIRENVQKQLNGYVSNPAILKNIDEYIVPPVLGNRSGVLGGIALAMQVG